MTRRVVLLVVGAVAAGLMLAQPASAAPSASEMDAALLTTAQVQRITGPIDPTQDSTKPLCDYSKVVRVCSRSWSNVEREHITSVIVQVAYYPSAIRAWGVFRGYKLQNRPGEVLPLELTVETSTASTFVVSTSMDQSTIRVGAGYHLDGHVVVSITCSAAGSTTVAELNACTRRLLAAQTAKARPLDE